MPRGLSIVGNHPLLGNTVPNTVVLRDDETGGDERAGDRVWSYQATFRAGTRLKHVYTNSGRAGRWEGLDVPRVRELQVEASPEGGPCTCRSNRSAAFTCRRTTGTQTPWVTT